MSEQRQDDTHSKHEQTANTASDARAQSAGATGPITTTRPTLRPTGARMATVVLAGVALLGVLTVVPSLVGGSQVASIARVGVGLLMILGIVRYVVQIIVLRRTTYKIHRHGIQREFELLFRTKAREVPFDKIRSHELQQSRVQSLWGCGSIALNQGLGSLVLSDVTDPHDTYSQIRTRLNDESQSVGP